MKDTILCPPVSSVSNTPYVGTGLKAEARRLEHRRQRRQWRKQIRSQLPRLSLLGAGLKWK